MKRIYGLFLVLAIAGFSHAVAVFDLVGDFGNYPGNTKWNGNGFWYFGWKSTITSDLNKFFGFGTYQPASNGVDFFRLYRSDVGKGEIPVIEKNMGSSAVAGVEPGQLAMRGALQAGQGGDGALAAASFIYTGSTSYSGTLSAFFLEGNTGKIQGYVTLRRDNVLTVLFDTGVVGTSSTWSLPNFTLQEGDEIDILVASMDDTAFTHTPVNLWFEGTAAPPNVDPVPEPFTMPLLAMATVAWYRRRRSNKAA